MRRCALIALLVCGLAVVAEAKTCNPAHPSPENESIILAALGAAGAALPLYRNRRK